MKRLIAMLASAFVLPFVSYAAPAVVWSDGTNLYSYANTNTVTNTLMATVGALHASSNETITGAWTFTNNVTLTATPAAATDDATVGWVRDQFNNGVFYYNSTNIVLNGYGNGTGYVYQTAAPPPPFSRTYASVTANQYVGEVFTPVPLTNPIGPATVSAWLACSGGGSFSIKPELYFTTDRTNTYFEAEDVVPQTVSSSTSNLFQWVIHYPNQVGSYYGMRRFKITSKTGSPTMQYFGGTNAASTLAIQSQSGSGGSTDSGVTNHAPSHAGAGSDPITSLGAITHTGLDSFAGQSATNVNVIEGTTLVIRTAATLPATTMNGNIALGSSWLSGDGGNEGVTVDANGEVWIKTNAAYTGAGRLNIVNAGPVIIHCARAGGSLSTPTNTPAVTIIGGFQGRPYGSTAWSSGGKVAVNFQTTELATDTSQGAYMSLQTTPTNSVTIRECVAITSGGDLQINANNGNLVPATLAGSVTYFVTNATSARALVKRGDGTVTLISPHNDKGEYVADSWNTFSGVHEVANITKLAQAVESMLPKEHPLKGQVYSLVTNTPSEDWRENEAMQEADSISAINRWINLPASAKETTCPNLYTKRPIPIWAATAQKQFDSKHIAEVDK